MELLAVPGHRNRLGQEFSGLEVDDAPETAGSSISSDAR